MKIVYCLLFFLLLAAQSCQSDAWQKRKRDTSQWLQTTDKPKILTTTAIIDDLVKQIGGNRVASLALIQGDLDPHSYQLVKGDDEKMHLADAIFYNGLGLEHSSSLSYFLKNEKKAVSLGNAIAQKHPPLMLYQDGQIDPHIWLDISVWKHAIPLIVTVLSDIDPQNSAIYKKNGDALTDAFLLTHEAVREQLQTIDPKLRYLITSHDAFNYFARAYLATPAEQQHNTWQARFAAPEGLAPDSQLSAADFQHILNHIKEYQIQFLFPESNVNRDSLYKIIDAGRALGLNLKMAAAFLYGDAMPLRDIREGESSYLAMLRHNAKVIADTLHGQNKGLDATQ